MMTNERKCAICHGEFDDNVRVIYSSRETFVFKPAHVPDTVNPALVSPAELEASRRENPDNLKTAVVNTFVDWGKAVIPEGAFHFRHQWCEPQKTGSGIGLRSNRHTIRFNRSAVRSQRG